MASFADLGLTPDLVEALAAEGAEVPTSFQESAIPVLLRGNSLLAQAGPGAGTLIAYGAPLLQTIDPEGSSPRALVLVPSSGAASELAGCLGRLAIMTAHRIAALGPPWALPEQASILFSEPDELLRAVRRSAVSLEEVQAVIVDGFGGIAPGERGALETLFEFLPREGQRVILAQPFTREAEAFGRAHLHRAIHIPPQAAQDEQVDAPPRRGSVFYRLTGEAKDPDILRTVAETLGQGAQHILLFFRNDDEAADAGDYLSLHGFVAGATGDTGVPVWLSVAELEARKYLDEWTGPGAVVTVSVDVPSDPDSLDRRHGGTDQGVVLVRPRELPHLRHVARMTGYELLPAREPPPRRVVGELERLADLIRRTLEEENLAPHYLAIEPLLAEYSAGEIAAAALARLQSRTPSPLIQQGGAAVEPAAAERTGPPPKTWVRLFVGVGDKDGVGPGDLLGAIAGEAGVEGSQVGKIEIRETFSLVEVAPSSADRIIRSLNGTTIRSRSVRVDYDRGGPRGRGGPPSRRKPSKSPRGDRPGRRPGPERSD